MHVCTRSSTNQFMTLSAVSNDSFTRACATVKCDTAWGFGQTKHLSRSNCSKTQPSGRSGTPTSVSIQRNWSSATRFTRTITHHPIHSTRGDLIDIGHTLACHSVTLTHVLTLTVLLVLMQIHAAPMLWYLHADSAGADDLAEYRTFPHPRLQAVPFPSDLGVATRGSARADALGVR